MIEQICPIWGTEAEVEDGDLVTVTSGHAGGKFQLARELYEDLTENNFAYSNHHPKIDKLKITTHILQHNIKRVTPKYLEWDEFEKASLAEDLTVTERTNLILKTLYWRYPKVGESIYWNEDVYVHAAAGTILQSNDDLTSPRTRILTYLYDCLDRELISYHGSDLCREQSIFLTVKGHQYIERLGYQLADSDQIFVAMWFTAETSVLYDQAIKSAIEGAGYKAMRIDEEPHNEKICDKIIAEIRKSKALIADITCGLAKPVGWSKQEMVGAPRGGVFYEAGFAQGLRLPVIWTVNHEIAEIENVSHFDIRQYNQIRWNIGNLEQAKEEIQNRIEATLGRGPH